MSRSGSKRVARVLPVAVVLLGAGLTAARKRRAARRARPAFPGRVPAPGQVPEEHPPTPVDVSSAPSDSSPTPKKAAPRPRAAKPKPTRAPAKPASVRKPSRAADRATVATPSAPAPAGAVKARVLAALTPDRGSTASEVATATGVGRGTVSTTLSRLVKTGEVVKADRGYRLPG